MDTVILERFAKAIKLDIDIEVIITHDYNRSDIKGYFLFKRV